MSTHYTVAPGREFTYPADPNSEGIIRNAGGVTQLPSDLRGHVKFKTVRQGEDCSDMPADSLAIYLARGWVIEERRDKGEGKKELGRREMDKVIEKKEEVKNV